MGHISSFFNAFLSTLSKVSRNVGGSPRLAGSGTSAQVSCSPGRKFISSDNGTFDRGCGDEGDATRRLPISCRKGGEAYGDWAEDSKKALILAARADDVSGSGRGSSVVWFVRRPSKYLVETISSAYRYKWPFDPFLLELAKLKSDSFGLIAWPTPWIFGQSPCSAEVTDTDPHDY